MNDRFRKEREGHHNIPEKIFQFRKEESAANSTQHPSLHSKA
jgi:hypothetical protein